ncbi:unnamed protein product, partial [marine sediment metagenome]
MAREYARAGVDYAKIEPFKQIIVEMGKQTLTFPNRRGVAEQSKVAEETAHKILALQKRYRQQLQKEAVPTLVLQ